MSDAAYHFSFRLPVTWKHPTITTGSTTVSKLLVQDTISIDVVGLLDVSVVSGRNIDAGAVAEGISEQGTSITGSQVVHLPVGAAEQITFEIPATATTLVVYGLVDGFYRDGRSYYVSFESTNRSVIRTAAADAFATWAN